MIYTVTFNPALDYYVFPDNFTLGKTNRSSKEFISFGGKGINVSIILSRLGIDNTALGFIAGFTGEALEKNLKSENIKTDFIKLSDGLTRINVKIKGEYESEINANGPDVSPDALSLLFEKLNQLQDGDTLVLSGSVSKNVPSDIYEQILSSLSNKKINFVLDAEGQLLLNTLKYKPFLIKPNLDELKAITPFEITTKEDIIRASKRLQEMGAKNVLVSCGKEGAVLITNEMQFIEQKALSHTAVNTVGAGDSMVAGFLAGIDKGFKYALDLASCAAAASVSSNCLAKKEDILNYLNKIYSR